RAMRIARNETNERGSLSAVSSGPHNGMAERGWRATLFLRREPRLWASIFRIGPRALSGEKPLEQGTALGFTHAARDVAAMVEGGKLQEVQGPPGRAALGVADAIHDPRQSDVNDSAGAHRTRLLRYVDRAVRQPPVPADLL